MIAHRVVVAVGGWLSSRQLWANATCLVSLMQRFHSGGLIISILAIKLRVTRVELFRSVGFLQEGSEKMVN